jgi:hypothetical protein
MKVQSSRLLLAAVWTALIAVPVLLGTPPALAGDAKVEVCHRPPGNLDNFHTIRISANALSAHLAHGDLPDACNALCATICDDGDACTVDDTGDCQQQGCPPEPRDPVDCDDGLNCTADSCVDGCINAPLNCVPSDLCHSSECAEPEGMCMETEKVCEPGETCNPTTGECEDTAPAQCPCADSWDNGVGLAPISGRNLSTWTCHGLGGPPLDDNLAVRSPTSAPFFFGDTYSLVLRITPDQWRCDDKFDLDLVGDPVDVPGLTAAEWTACRDLLAATNCMFP